MAGVGAISWLSYARRITQVPVSVVAQAAGVASYPFMAELFVKKDFTRFFKTINSALQNVLTLLIPLSVWMILVSEPTIRLIFEQGRFSTHDTVQTARLLQILLLCVSCWGYQQVLGRAFYARLDTLSPAVLGTIVTILVFPVFSIFTSRLGATGVACASAASIIIYSAALTVWWRIKMGRDAFTGLVPGSFKVLCLSIISALPAWGSEKLVPFEAQAWPLLSALLQIAVSGLCFGTCWAVLSGRFIPELARPFLEKAGPVGRRLLKSR
jgi:putative peptidoglycan lipid II flippase